MKGSWQRLTLMVALAGSASFFGSTPALAAGKQTLTGEVGDAMCGVKHMEGTARGVHAHLCSARIEVRAGRGRQDLRSEH